MEYFKTVDLQTKEKLIQQYKYDFLLFDYDWKQYL